MVEPTLVDEPVPQPEALSPPICSSPGEIPKSSKKKKKKKKKKSKKDSSPPPISPNQVESDGEKNASLPQDKPELLLSPVDGEKSMIFFIFASAWNAESLVEPIRQTTLVGRYLKFFSDGKEVFKSRIVN